MNTGKNKKIEEILGSLDTAPKAAAPDFFYTRLKSRMEKELLKPASKPKRILQPAFAFAGLLIVLLINAVVLLNKGGGSAENTTAEPDLQSFAAEYRLNDNINAILFDLNQDK